MSERSDVVDTYLVERLRELEGRIRVLQRRLGGDAVSASDRGKYACLDCAHCFVSMGDTFCTEATPPTAEWWCEKGKWSLDTDSEKATVAACLDEGASCPHFEPEVKS